MKWFIATLGVLIAAAALLYLAILYPRPATTSAYFSTVCLVIMASIVAAFVCRDSLGMFWRGFALFAGGYLLVATLLEDLDFSGDRISFIFGQSHAPRRYLATSYLLAWIYDVGGGEELWTSGGTRVPVMHLLGVTPSVIPKDFYVEPFKQFLLAGHSVLAVVVGWLGGMAAAWAISRCSTRIRPSSPRDGPLKDDLPVGSEPL